MKENKIVLGTVQFGVRYGINRQVDIIRQEDVSAILDSARQNGIDELDTADGYGTALEALKHYLENDSEAFDIMSKFTTKNSEPFSLMLEKTLKRLGLEKLKGYYFHRYQDFLNFKEKQEMLEARRRGLIESIGVSLYGLNELEKALNTDWIDVIQLPYNLLDSSRRKRELINYAKKEGKKIYIRSVFLQGLFMMNLDSIPSRLFPLKPYLIQINNLAKKYNRPVNDIALNYCIQNKDIERVIIGVDTVNQLTSNMNVAKNKLPDELINEIDEIEVVDIELLNPSNWSF